jgi:hypothetical protein
LELFGDTPTRSQAARLDQQEGWKRWTMIQCKELFHIPSHYNKITSPFVNEGYWYMSAPLKLCTYFIFSSLL